MTKMMAVLMINMCKMTTIRMIVKYCKAPRSKMDLT